MPVANANVGMPTASHVRAMSSSEVHALSVEALGLDGELLDLESPEALAALVRRAASFTAPCSPRVLRHAVLRALDGLVSSGADASQELRMSIDEMIEALTSYGDLLDLPTVDLEDGAGRRTLYLAPPTYVCIDDVLFLLGGALDGGDPVPSDLRASVEYRSHTRRMRPGDAPEVAKRLRAIGWVEIRRDLWLPAPSRETPEQMVARANAALAVSSTVGEVPGLVVLDPETPVTFYRGRWVEPTRKSGRYVARREQRYGADLWSYVKVSNGTVTHLVDLPLDRRSDLRPCDTAWHLQMAIDATSERPQLYRRRASPPAGFILIDFFSPVPLWARRRWDVLGEEIARRGSLFAYSFPIDVFTDVERTLHSDLWLAEVRSA
jgi:hypothetical protein